jgi:hypothetical protein
LSLRIFNSPDREGKTKEKQGNGKKASVPNYISNHPGPKNSWFIISSGKAISCIPGNARQTTNPFVD